MGVSQVKISLQRWDIGGTLCLGGFFKNIFWETEPGWLSWCRDCILWRPKLIFVFVNSTKLKGRFCSIWFNGWHFCYFTPLFLQIFGPVQSIIKFKTLEEAVRRANDSSYGLAAGIVTKDINTALIFAQSVHAGSVW